MNYQFSFSWHTNQFVSILWWNQGTYSLVYWWVQVNVLLLRRFSGCAGGSCHSAQTGTLQSFSFTLGMNHSHARPCKWRVQLRMALCWMSWMVYLIKLEKIIYLLYFLWWECKPDCPYNRLTIQTGWTDHLDHQNFQSYSPLKQIKRRAHSSEKVDRTITINSQEHRRT